MNEGILMERMGSSFENMPKEVEVHVLRQFSKEELERRSMRLLRVTGETCKLPLDRGNWVEKPGRTMIQLPRGARMSIYHASGAMHLTTGLAPMEALFEKAEDKRRLIKHVEELAKGLKIHEFAGQEDQLAFERLWQIKAAASDPGGKMVDPVLCRIVGAYRHYVNGIPVWGPASVAVTMAGGGQLDSLTVQIRERTSEVVARVKVINPEQAARQIINQLAGLMNQKDLGAFEGVKSSYYEFGYLSLPKRKTQRVLAPVFIAGIEVDGEEAQAYQMVAPASERDFMPLCRNGTEAVLTAQRG